MKPTPRTDAVVATLNKSTFNLDATDCGKLHLLATQLERELDDLREEVRQTLMENLHLADGDTCTLKRLKDAIGFEMEDSCENTAMASAAERPTD